MPFNWHGFHESERQTPAAVDSRRRLRICLGVLAALLAVVFLRAVQLEVSQGAAFRAEAVKPLERRRSLPGVRGRILARNGAVLACDKKIVAVAVHYRYLEEPPDPRWLRLTARSRLTPAERKGPPRVAEEETRVLAQRAEAAHRLSRLCGLTAAEWDARARRVQARVERIVASVNRQHHARATTAEAPSESLAGRARQTILDALRGSSDDASPVVVAEERDYHVMAEDVPLAVVAEIEGNPQRYPGVKMLTETRRSYPSGALAAHALGYLGYETAEEKGAQGVGNSLPTDSPANDPPAADLLGRMGLERQYEPLLRGRPGTAIELTDHSGRILSSYRREEPGVGRDLVVTLDPLLQQAAESLLDSALERRTLRHGEEDSSPDGGAILVMDVRDGALAAAASAPRFDPNVFVAGKPAEVAAVLADPAGALVDRTSRMAIPPGSVFKVLTAIAMVESGGVDPQASFTCRGYLHQPDRQRCAIYVHQQIGHGEVTLARAMALSCNVYFLHHAEQMGPAPLAAWADRFGFGRPTGVDLPGEKRGQNGFSPLVAAGQAGRKNSSDPFLQMAIGQGRLEVTPLQVAVMLAAVANGGQVVTPHLAAGLGLPDEMSSPETSAATLPDFPSRSTPNLRPATLAAVREGLRRVVDDEEGTAHGTVCLDTPAIAAKTGTAETGGGRAEHAWLAAYVPADRPRWAIVVVLEHGGDAAIAAGPVVKRLVLRMQQLGLLD